MLCWPPLPPGPRAKKNRQATSPISLFLSLFVPRLRRSASSGLTQLCARPAGVSSTPTDSISLRLTAVLSAVCPRPLSAIVCVVSTVPSKSLSPVITLTLPLSKAVLCKNVRTAIILGTARAVLGVLSEAELPQSMNMHRAVKQVVCFGNASKQQVALLVSFSTYRCQFV